MTAQILTFVQQQKVWRTPWGHEFGTYQEARAFINGMTYMADCISSHAEYLTEKFQPSRASVKPSPILSDNEE